MEGFSDECENYSVDLLGMSIKFLFLGGKGVYIQEVVNSIIMEVLRKPRFPFDH